MAIIKLERANNGERMLGYHFSIDSLKEIQKQSVDYHLDIDEIDEILLHLDCDGLLKI